MLKNKEQHFMTTDSTVYNQEEEDCVLSKCEICTNVRQREKYSLNDQLLKKRLRWEQWNTVNRAVLQQVNGNLVIF
jgi:hypothetical protein